MSKIKKDIIDNEDLTMAEFLKGNLKISQAGYPSPPATSMWRDMRFCRKSCGRRLKGRALICGCS